MSLSDRAPFVLPEDARAVEAFNRHFGNERSLIRTDLLPEPFVGSLDAPIVLLALNPGYSDEDFEHHRTGELPGRIRGCAAQERCRYPLYYLDPEIACPGADWWVRKLGPLWREFGREIIAQSVVMLEFFPYHSRGFAHGHLRLPSQEYTFWILREALRRGAVVVGTRGWSVWVGAVPELLDHPSVARTRSVQNITLSRRNLDRFELIEVPLRRAGRTAGV